MANKALEDLKQLVNEPEAIEAPAITVAKGMTTKEKWAAIASVGKTLNKEFKCDNSLVKLGDRVGKPVPNTPTGIYTLDHNVLVCGGLPKGRIIEFYGAASAGKSSLTYEVIAEEQRSGNLVAYIDVEHAMDPNYVSTFGVDVNNLIVSQPDYGEQALETADALVRSGAVSLIVIDSVAALTPQKELEGDFGDSVIYETPVYIRTKGNPMVNIVQIGDLYCKESTGWYKKHKRIEILTHRGWAPLLGVQKKKNTENKTITYTRTATGYIGTTKDHSLFVNGKEASPAELKIFDRVDVYETKIEFGEYNLISEDMAWLLGLYVAEGSTPWTPNCNRFEVCGTDKTLMERCQNIVQTVFGVSGKLRTAHGPEGNRKTLHAYNVPSNLALSALMHACVSSGRSRVKQVPEFILNSTVAIQTSFIKGFWDGDGNHSAPDKPRRFYNNSWLVIAGIQIMLNKQGLRTNTVINNSRLKELSLYENSGRLVRKENEIIQFYEGEAPEFLYDICTEAGTFVSAIGNIICHNSNMGLHARLMSQACRKLRGICAINTVTIIFINQVRSNIGGYGSPITTPGGKALSFYASVRLEIGRVSGDEGKIMSGGVQIGHRVKIKAVKNKVGPPFRTTEVDLIYNKGFDKEADFIDYAKSLGVIECRGAWTYFKDEKRTQGMDKLKDLIKGDRSLYNEVEAEVQKALAAQQAVEDVKE